ncbi:MAG: hypothetical protein LBB67_05820 [Oscillospiraceae bacterium]|jgi:hypothetical protein|nr:hypothetical protein [Oscillospiraceae bacterium]
MMETKQALEQLSKGMEPTLTEAGFAPVARDEDDALTFVGEAGVLRIWLRDDKAALGLSRQPVDIAQDGDFDQLSLSLLELAAADERDIKYVIDDFCDVLREKFVRRKGAAAGKKLPKSISKTAIKNGDAYYDAITFGNSFTGIFSELRQAYKDNYELYGEFLCEEFFRQHGNAVVLETIRRNDKTEMQRMFRLFNDVYENGLNDVQSLLVVTILGGMENDQRLLANCVDYMSEELAPVVIRVNAYLASKAGQTARQRLEHPPIYKPKKKKKQGVFSQMFSGGGAALPSM